MALGRLTLISNTFSKGHCKPTNEKKKKIHSFILRICHNLTAVTLERILTIWQEITDIER